MKLKIILVLLFLAQTFNAQEITGSWQGDLDIQGMKLPFVLNIKKDGNAYSSSALSPKQSDKEFPVDKTEFNNNELIFEILNLKVTYKGKFITNHFEGIFTQNGRDFPLTLNKQKSEEKTKKYTVQNLGNKKINTEKLDEFLDYLVQNKQAIGSVSIFRFGEEVYHRNFGQNQLNNVKFDENTEYQIGSISKTFTAIMLMQLVEKRKLNLDDKLSKFYPEIPNSGKITIKNMLNHSSGLGDYVGNPENNWLFSKPVGDKAIIDEIAKQGVSFQPGEKTQYSNSAYFLLSRILEKISKKPYNVILKENILSKANLPNTFSVNDNQKNIFKSYENENGNWQIVQDFNFQNCIGLGDITSTTEDLNVFINALFNYKFVSKETLDKMLPEKGKGFGLGIMKIPFYNLFSYGHGGDTAGSHSAISYDPENKLSFAITINGEKLPHNEISIDVLSIVYNAEDFEFPKFSDSSEVKSSDLDAYLGTYSTSNLPLKLTITKNENQLIAQGTGQPSFHLEAVSKDKFKFEKANLEITFSPKENKLLLLQNGNHYELKKE